MKKTLVAIALAVIFTLALAVPAFAQAAFFATGDLSQTISYDFEGQIDFEKHVGHLCNTGAEMKQVISGDGKLEKASEIYMKGGFLDVMDSNSFVTAPDALNNMEVITSIELCSPPKHVFVDDFYLEYTFGDRQIEFDYDEGDVVDLPLIYLFPDLLDMLIEEGFVEPLTKQIWATSVSANPGQMGNYTGGFKAAYGPFGYDDTFDNAWWFVDEDDEPWPNLNYPVPDGAAVGEDFVGNYFGIEQFAYTSGGVTKRYTSISSPFSHAYFMNDLTVTGMASITEAFTMGNLDEGTAAATDWWDLF